ncbi:MAG: SpoIIE family protein phosphatase [Halioglobus sp.]
MMPSEGAESSRIRITCEADATRSVIEAARWCKSKGLTNLDSQSVSTAVSELSRNILKYAGRGEIIFSSVAKGGQDGLNIVASDSGPGIPDIANAMRDHFSSSGTLGLGLPGVKRLMDTFDIESAPGKGTKVSVVKWREPPRQQSFTARAVRAGTVMRPLRVCDEHVQHSQVDCAAKLLPCRGERASGDLAVIIERADFLLLAVVDGLGHGYEASRVAYSAGSLLTRLSLQDPSQILEALHNELRGSLGAAAGVAIFHPDSGELHYSGVGNIVGRMFGSRENRMTGNPGLLGDTLRSQSPNCIKLSPGDVFILYSDGIRDRFELSDYPQLQYQAAETVARTLIERFGKSHDDASCVVLRYTA